MKKIFAILGVIVLIGLYLSTLVFAFVDHSASLHLLKASIAATILLPVLLYAYTLIFKVSKKDEQDSDK
ncbi:hypothetical protein ACTQ6A_14055 [Lachnospiraceae bacterium LCP25S3_G4]